MDEMIAMAPIQSTGGCCVVCGNEIRVMCRVGTPVCGEICDKKLKGEK